MTGLACRLVRPLVVRCLAVVAVLAVGACSSGGGGRPDAATGGSTGGDAAADGARDRPASDAADRAVGDAELDGVAFDAPVAVQVPATSAPTDLPPNTGARCMVSGSDLTPAPACWVVRWGRWTYWVLTDVGNSNAFILQAYDAGGARVQGGWPRTKQGARYPWLITVDKGAESIAIFGQGNAIVNVPWNELRIDQTGGDAGAGGDAAPDGPAYAIPTVVRVDRSAAPTAALPANAQFVCTVSGTDASASGTCPVVRWGRWTYWAFSAVDNSSAFLVTPYDQTGAIASQGGWPKLASGARYLWGITVDASAMTVTFSGQADATATMTWADLRIDQP